MNAMTSALHRERSVCDGLESEFNRIRTSLASMSKNEAECAVKNGENDAGQSYTNVNATFGAQS